MPKLWKVNVKKGEIKVINVSTEEDIEQKINEASSTA
jgi:hypothetical protein